MNILIINSFYYPDMVGGAEHSVKILAEGLKKSGHNVAILCENMKANSAECSIEEINGVLIYRDNDSITQKCGYIKRFRNRARAFNNKHCKNLCERIYSEFKPDIVHTNNLAFISTYVWKYFNEKKIPVIHTSRDYWLLDHSCIYNHSNKLVNFFYQKYYRKQSNRYVDIFTAPSQFTKEIFLQNGYFKNSDSRCVVNCVDLDMQEVSAIIRKKSLLEEEHIKFLYVGALGKHKGINNLLNAFSKINNDKISLTICGSGEEEVAVRQFCEKDSRIKYLGQLNSKELKEIYITHDVLVVPSVWDEPFGRIVIEGNQYGLPVIGSNKAGIKEIIEATHAGETYQFDSTDELTVKIAEFSDRKKIKRYYANIVGNIDKYSLNKQIESYVALYKKAAEID